MWCKPVAYKIETKIITKVGILSQQKIFYLQQWTKRSLKMKPKKKSKLQLKYDFVTSYFQKDEPLISWTLLQHYFVVTFGRDCYCMQQSRPKVRTDTYVVKVINWSEIHLSEMTSYKIHTLVISRKLWKKSFNIIQNIGQHFFSLMNATTMLNNYSETIMNI